MGEEQKTLALAHSPHAAIGLAVGRVNADSSLAVLHGPSVVPQFAVGCGSGETKAGGQLDSGSRPTPPTPRCQEDMETWAGPQQTGSHSTGWNRVAGLHHAAPPTWAREAC
jgi:hypothetical protein